MLQPTDAAQLTTGLDVIEARVQDQPYTVTAPSRRAHWRMLIVPMSTATTCSWDATCRRIEFAVTRLIWIDLLVGLAVLIALAVVGAAIVRTSLVPLVEIEQTAGAIAAGDLTRRVPDPEPDAEQPRTELAGCPAR